MLVASLLLLERLLELLIVALAISRDLNRVELNLGRNGRVLLVVVAQGVQAHQRRHVVIEHGLLVVLAERSPQLFFFPQKLILDF
jgi:hypothetical protein